jgi:tetratricopeptide (TPR) repeat protein
MKNLLLTMLAVATMPLMAISQTPASAPVPKPTLKPTTSAGGRTGPPPRRNRPPALTRADLQQRWPAADSAAVGAAQPKTGKTRAEELFVKAYSLNVQGKPQDALPLLTEAESLEPKNFDIQFVLGAVFTRLGQGENAIAAYRKAVALKPENALARSNYCASLTEAVRLAEALDHCRESFRLDPKLPAIREQIALLHLFGGQPTEALNVLSTDAADAATLSEMGTTADAYLMLEEYPLAADLYDKIALRWPKVALAQQRLSLVYFYLDRSPEAIAAAKRFVEMEPKFAYAHYNLGKRYQAGGYVDEAIAAYTQAAVLDPTAGAPYLGLMEMYEITGNEDAQVASAKSAYRLLPRSGPLSYRYAKVMMEAGSTEEAVPILEQVNSLTPNQPDIMRSLAFAYLDVKRKTEALAMLELANQIAPLPPNLQLNIDPTADETILSRFDETIAYVKSKPRDPNARRYLAGIYLLKKMYPDAERQYLELVGLEPTLGNYNLLAVFYSENRKYAEAAAAYKKAAELTPHHVVYMSLSNTYLKLGRLDDAVDAARKAVETKATFDTRINLGELLLKKGDRPGAIREYQAAFELASGDRRINFRLAWLYVLTGNKEGALRHYNILKSIAPTEIEYLENCIQARYGPQP